VFGVAAIAAALLACSRSQPPAEYASLPLESPAMEPTSPVMRAPLQAPLDPTRSPPSADYDPLTPSPRGHDPYAPSNRGDSAYPPPPRSGSAYPPAPVAEENGQRLIWRASPRWAAIKKEGDAPRRKQSRNTRFEAAKEKAAEVGVENLTDDDIEGLNPEQLKELRGY
jgi:hypothetical protein